MRRAGKITFAAFALVVAALLFVVWWSGRESALQWLARTAMDKSNGALAISGVAGSLYGPLSIAELVFEDEDRRVVLRALKFDWAPKDLLDRNIHVTEFAADEVESLTKKQSERDKPLASPESLELPFTFEVEPARIKCLIVADARGRQQFNDLVFHLDYDGEIYRAALKSIEFPAGHASAELELGDSRPFSLQGKAASSGKWQEHAYSAQLNLSGTLSAVQFDAKVRSAEASANASGMAIPFEKFPLKRAQLAASNIDPSQFRKNLPHADIDVNFTMREEDATLAGALSLDNALPGPSDGQRLPLEKVAAAFAGSAQALDLENIELALHGGGKFVGGGNYDGKTLHLDLRAHAVDLHTLHSALQPTQLKGDVRIAANQKTQSLDANLAHDKLRIALAAAHDDGEVTVSQGALRAGKSELRFSGSAELATPNAFHVEAFLKRFNPADFGQFPMAELNATLNADGKREPDLRAKLDVALEDSRWHKVPLRGKADVSLAGEAIDNAKVALHAGANRVELNGAFGRASDAMRFMIAAPRLNELGPPWRGSVEAHGSLRGTMTQAALDLDFNAANLKAPGDIAVNTIRAQIEGAGSLKELTAFSSLEFSARGTRLSAKTIRVGDFEGTGTVKDGVNGKVAVSLAAKEVSTPQLELIHAKANAEGSRAAHRVSAEGAGSDLDFQAVVRGNWRGNAWEGSIERLGNKGRYPVQLLAPAKLSFSPPRFHLQHARLQLAEGRVSLDEFAMDDASIASAGSLNAFPVAYLMSFVKQEAIAGTDLVIGGDWNLKVADKIGGTMTLKRESGDVILDKDIALGLTQLEFSARAQQNRIQTALVLAGARTGMANASAEIPLKRHDKRWRIEPAESLRANIDAAMPSIAWLSALAKPGSELGGALTLKATAQGSWNNPQISAELNGERLSANFPKTKIALHEGELRASLNAQSRLGSPDADVKLNLKASAPSYGNVSGDAQTRVTKEGDAWRIARNAPLKLDLNAAIPSLAWANAFVKSENAVFDGALDFKATARGTIDHPQLSAELNGDGLSASLPQTEVQLTGAQLRATLHAEPRAGSPQADVKMGLNVSAPPYGNVSGEAQTRISNNGKAWAISRDAPLAATLKAEMPSLAWTRAMLPLGSAVEGSFNLQTAASGTWGKPDLSGKIRGEALKIQHADSGLNLEGGVLRATLKNSTLLVEQFTLRGGEGTLNADGSAVLGELTPVVKINFKADKLTALSRPDRVLVLSGGGDLGMKDKKFSADAKLKADRALIELPDASAPTLGKDVVVAGDSAQKPKSGDALSGVNLALEFDLGDNFIVNGKGLDAKLAGLINLSVDGKPPPTAKGTIRVTKGTYAAYGQRLTIERGIVAFSGPIDNPALDIVAMRKNQPVEAGVAIAGTALNPRLTLVSNPVVPDTEKVSWLVLGRGLSGSNKNDLALVQAAAGALLAHGQSVSLQQRIAQATGLDEVGISGSGLEGSVLTVGKRLSSRVYLTFERGLTGASNIAKLRYSLTPRWSLETRAGSDTALDLFYTLSLD